MVLLAGHAANAIRDPAYNETHHVEKSGEGKACIVLFREVGKMRAVENNRTIEDDAEAVRSWLRRAIKFVEARFDRVEAVAKPLLARGTLCGEEVKQLINSR